MRIRMLGRSVAATLVALAGCLSAPEASNPYDPGADPARQAPAAISGLVYQPGTDAGHGPLLAGALVRLSGPVATSPVTTAADGAFAFSNLTPGQWALEVLHPQFTTLQRSYSLAAGEAQKVDLVLTDLSRDSPFVGHVTGIALKSGEQALPADEQDHSGIIVEVENAGVRTVTNRAGRFDAYLNFGTYNFVFSAPNYNLARKDAVVVIAGETTEIADPVVLDANPGAVSGKVVLEGAAADGHGDVLVAILGTSKTTVTAPDGSFRLTDVPAGTYLLTASKERFESQSAGGVVVTGGHDTVLPNLVLPLARGEIAGVAKLNGLSDHAGSVVTLGGTSIATTTANDGSFLLAGVPVGTYDLTVTHDAFVPVVVGGVNVNDRSRSTVAAVSLLPRRGEFTIAGGAAFTGTRTVTLGLTAQGVTEYRVSEDPGFSGASWTSFAPSPSFQLSAGDGTKTVYAQYRDAGATESAVFSASIVLDATPPVPGAVTVDSGSGWSRSATGVVSLAFGASDATSGVTLMQISNDDVLDEPFEPYVAAKTHTLAAPATDGLRTVRVRFKDAAGNVSATTTATVTLDRTAPTLTSFTIDCGDGRTGTCPNPYLRANVNAAGAAFLALSNDAGFPVEPYQPFSSTPTVFVTPGDGAKTVYLRLKDLAGNTSSDFQASVTIDGTAPTITGFTVSGKAADNATSQTLTNTTAVTLAIGATDAIATASKLTMAVDEVGLATSATFGAYATSKAFTLSSGDGVKNLILRVKDEAGNVVTSNAAITLDTTAPLAPLVSLASTVTSSTAIVATLSANGATQMCLWGDLVGGSADQCGSNGWESQTATKSLTLTTGSGLKTVNARFRDAAGNVATATAATVTLDSAAPVAATGAKVTITGTDKAGSSTTVTRLIDVAVAITGLSDAQTGVKEMLISENAAFAGASWQAYATSVPFTLSTTDGTKTIYAKVRDGALNESSTVSGTIVLDRTAPDAAAMTINAGSGYTTNPLVTVTFTVQGSAVDYSLDGGTTWVACPGGCDAAAPGDTASVNFGTARGPQKVKLVFRDAAGNVSAPFADSVNVDDKAPNGTSMVSVSPHTTSVDLSLSGATDPPTPVGTTGVAAASGIDYFEVKIADPDGRGTPTTTTFTTTTGTITGLPSLQSYAFSARTVDRAGNTSAWSAATTVVVGLSASQTEGAVVGQLGDRVHDFRGVLLWLKSKTNSVDLVACDTRRQRCRDAGFKTLHLSSGSDGAIASVGRTLVVVTTDGPTGRLWVFNGSLDNITDPAAWSSQPLIAVHDVDLGTLQLAANGRGLTAAWVDVSTATPKVVVSTCDEDPGACARSPGLWSTAVTVSDTNTVPLSAFADYGLSLDAGVNHLYVSWPAMKSGGAITCTTSGTCGYAVATCTQTNGCASVGNWAATRIARRVGTGFDGARPHATRVLEVGSAAYLLGEQFVFTPGPGDVTPPASPTPPTGPVIFKCSLPTTATSDACRAATDWSAGENLRSYGGFEPGITGRASLESWNGALHFASSDPSTGAVYYGRCREAASDCAHAVAWDVAKVLLAPNANGQADIAVVQGNPYVSWARDQFRTMLVEPPTPAPLARAIVPDYGTGGVKASWVARDENAVEGYRVDYNTSGFTSSFDQQAVTGDPAADEVAISSTAALAHYGVVASFDGDDLGLAEPRFRAAGPKTYVPSQEIQSFSPGALLPRYAGNASCQVLAYPTSQTRLHLEACPRTADCSAAANWKTADLDVTAGAVGGVALDVNSTRVWVAIGRPPDPMPGTIYSFPIAANCTMTTGASVTSATPLTSTVTGSPASGNRYVAIGLSATDATVLVSAVQTTGTLGNAGQYTLQVTRCAAASGCDAAAEWSAPLTLLQTPGSPPPYVITTPVPAQDGATFYVAASIVPTSGARSVDVWACPISSGCATGASWSRHTVFSAVPSAASVLLKSQGNAMTMAVGDQFAVCSGVACNAARAWSRSMFAPDPLGDTPGRWGVFGLAGNDQIWSGGAGGQLQIGRCRQRCWLADSWLGGFTQRDATIVDSVNGSPAEMNGYPGEIGPAGEVSLVFAQKTGSGNGTRAKFLTGATFDVTLP